MLRHCLKGQTKLSLACAPYFLQLRVFCGFPACCIPFETESAMSKTIEKFLEEALVIMVIYRCTPEKSAAWNSLVLEAITQKATIDLLVYDNSPEPHHFPTFPFMRLHYRHNSQNPGVSKAYNEGCALAREKDKRWLLLLDQDTSMPAGWLGTYSLHRYFALNSGLLIDREVFESVGGYDESIPLYFSDFAFMRKLKKNNYRLSVLDLLCQHGLSALEKQDEASALARFKQYCHGSKRFTQYTHQSFLHFCIAGGRAIRLGIRHRSLNFIGILIQSWVTG